MGDLGFKRGCASNTGAAWPHDVLPVLLAGGKGSRLHELTQTICKPAVPFLGTTRIVDFTMENLRLGGVPEVMVATQYRGKSLHTHLKTRWQESMSVKIRHAPQMMGRAEGSRGTADAVRLLIDEIDSIAPRDVLILAADHVYRMDYRRMIDAHRATGAAVTVAADCVPRHTASAFGVLETDPFDRIVRFVEKPGNPPSWSRDPSIALASMGLYVFRWDALRTLLLENPGALDFGHDILPAAVSQGRTFAYAPSAHAPLYWRDVGTLDALRAAALDFMSDSPPFALPSPPGATPRLGIMDSVIMEGAFVSEGALVSNCIVAPGVTVPFACAIGVDPASDAVRYRRTPLGTILVTPGMISAMQPKAARHVSVAM
ncbi:sugar phosphate nucleotidyltransferase [Palleronia sp.]|uniref:sugar phosphate nucleotidyltransferase n=1 Tax=Palleronia sp. TaxID=1940284 RepID=UPI0035C845BD